MMLVDDLVLKLVTVRSRKNASHHTALWVSTRSPAPQPAELIALAEESHEADSLEEIEGDLPEGHAGVLEAESEAEAMWTSGRAGNAAAGSRTHGSSRK
jgi:hypothetical protein